MNMDEPRKHCAKYKKPDTKGHILYGSIYMKYPEQVNPQRQKVDRSFCQGLGGEENGDQFLNG